MRRNWAAVLLVAVVAVATAGCAGQISPTGAVLGAGAGLATAAVTGQPELGAAVGLGGYLIGSVWDAFAGRKAAEAAARAECLGTTEERRNVQYVNGRMVVDNLAVGSHRRCPGTYGQAPAAPSPPPVVYDTPGGYVRIDPYAPPVPAAPPRQVVRPAPSAPGRGTGEEL